MLFLDAHTHIGSNRNSLLSVEEMIAMEQQAGFSGALFAPLVGVMAESDYELDLGNAEALELFERYPDFLYPGVSVHPSYVKRSLYWLDAFRERGLVWCGEWLSYTCNEPFDQQGWAPFFEYAQKQHWIVQMHNAEEVATVAKRYPDVSMIGSHLNPAVLPMLTELPNVFVDVSGLHGGLVPGSLPQALETFGADRLLLGTDTPVYDPEPFILRSKRDFPPDALEKIAGGNLLKLLQSHGAKHAFGRNLQH